MPSSIRLGLVEAQGQRPHAPARILGDRETWTRVLLDIHPTAVYISTVRTRQAASCEAQIASHATAAVA